VFDDAKIGIEHTCPNLFSLLGFSGKMRSDTIGQASERSFKLLFMPSIVTYDVPKKHVELKQALFAMGYKDKIKGNKCSIIYFPNTTLYHDSKTPDQARKDVQQVCNNLSLELERCIATKWEDWSVICGEPFGS
jgi:hypothetical protein